MKEQWVCSYKLFVLRVKDAVLMRILKTIIDETTKKMGDLWENGKREWSDTRNTSHDRLVVSMIKEGTGNWYSTVFVSAL